MDLFFNEKDAIAFLRLMSFANKQFDLQFRHADGELTHTNGLNIFAATSAGDKDGWHLPNKGFLNRLAAVITLSSGKIQGVYFTNLQNFSKPAWNSKTMATQLFDNKPNISFDYGNKGGGDTQDSYLIKVSESETLSEKSSFEVGRVDISKPEPYTKLSTFNCHKK
jgi:hypothetical protein